jgi:chromosome segregation ATPase
MDFNNQLDLQRKEHEEVVTQLKREIFRLEDFSESQQEQALKMEEEKAMAVQRLKELQYEIESERKSHEVEVNILSRKLDNAENDTARLDQDLKKMAKEQKLLQLNYEAKLSKAENEVSALQSQLQHANATISNQSSLQSELSHMKERLETQKKEFIRKSSDALAKLEGKHMEQTKAVKSKHRTVVESLQNEIGASKQRERKLVNKLDRSSSELEKKENQVRELQISAEAARKKISVFETGQAQHISEMSALQNSITLLQAEISQMKSAEVAHDNKISSLKAQLQKDFEFSSLSDKQTISQKDEMLRIMKTEKEIRSRIISELITGISEGITGQIDTLQSSCRESLVKYRGQLDRALLDLTSITKTLTDKDTMHMSVLDKYQAEIDHLQEKLKTSHHNLDELNESREQLQTMRDREIDELRSKLEQALKSENLVPSDTVSSRHITVDAGSGQVISGHHDTPTKQQELQEIIHTLNGEIEQLRQAEKLSMITTEETNQMLLEREEEIRQAKLEIECLHRKTHELELELEQKTLEVTMRTTVLLTSTNLFAFLARQVQG